MTHPRLAISLALLAPALFAQDHTITIKPQGDTPTRYTIESGSKIETTRKMLMNGEEGGFGGGGGGRGRGQMPQGPVNSKSKFVFVDGGSWRQYETAEAKITRPGVDGETNEQSVTGDLQGKKVSLGAEPAVMEGDKTTPIAGQAARNLRKVDFSGLAPTKPLALNATYEIGNPFKAALAGLSHPLNVAQPGQGGGRNRGGEGAGDAAGGGRRRGGGEGGDAAGGGEGRRAGGRGQGGGMRGMGGDLNLIAVMSSEGATPKLVGKLTKVENGIATIEISGEVAGEGAADKLGLGGAMGMMRGRGGRGGEGGEGGQAPQAESKAKLKVAVTGTMTIDVAAGALQSLNLSGKLDAHDSMKMTRETQEGDTMEIETDTTRKGEFSVTVNTAPAK